MPTVASTDLTTRWYVYSVSYRKELDLCDALRSAGIEAYVPMRFKLHTAGGHKVRRQEPAIYGLVFARGSRPQLLAFREECALRTYIFLRSQRLTDGTLRYACVGDGEMDNFMRLNDIEGAKLTYYKPEELRLAKGEKVRIMDGPFEGITGTIQKLPRRQGQYLVVSLSDIALAAVSIRPEYIQPLTKNVPKSADVEKDSKRLAQLALSVIEGCGDRQAAIVRDEMEQIEAALDGCKTYLPNDRANYHFALYASAMATGKPAGEHKAELLRVMPRLKTNNLLLPLAHILFYMETGDEASRLAVEAITGKWRRDSYTAPQKHILRLWHTLKTKYPHTAG